MNNSRPPKQLPLTVALLTYNRCDSYLKKSVEAILGQTYRQFEFLILDNASTDATPEYVLSLKDPRIRYVRNATGSSVEFNYLSAYHLARGHRILVTHDDDIMEPDMLEQQMRFMDQHPDVILAWTGVTLIDSEDKVISASHYTMEDSQVFKPGEYLLNFLYSRLWPVPSTIILDRRYNLSWPTKLHYFNSKTVKQNRRGKQVEGAEDALFPARANVKHSVAFIAKPLMRYRLHLTQGTNNVDLSAPSIHLYNALKRLARKSPLEKRYDSLFDSYVARYRLQQKLSQQTRYPLHPATSSLFVRQMMDWSRSVASCAEAFYPVLPLFILGQLMQPVNARQAHVSTALCPQPDKHYTTATQAFYAWQQRLIEGKSAASSLGITSGVAILGSALVAALLILDFRQAGIEVVACLESNVPRQGGCLLGVPIKPIQQLSDDTLGISTVVLSSEKNQEAFLEEIINKLACRDTRIVSWKQLVSEGDMP
jgi:glycosyltransferase involved in cell wall biosynthesis